MRSDSSIHWAAYPALLVAGTFAFGIFLYSTVRVGSVVLWGAGALAGLLLFAAVEWWDRHRMVTLAPLGRIVAVMIVGVCVGAVRQAVYETPSPRALAFFAENGTDRAVTLTGAVDDAPTQSQSRTRFTLAVDTLSAAVDTFAVDGQVRVTLRPSPWEDSTGTFPRIFQGDRLQLHGTVRPAPDQRNPGGFDYAAYLSRRGTCCVMYIGHPKNVRRMGTDRNLLTQVVVAGRHHIRRQIGRYVPSTDGRAVLHALLLGDRSRISDAQRQRFAKTGLMHLFAVSGLHVFLVGMVFYMLLRPLLMRFRLRWRVVEVGRAILTVVLLGFYMALTGSRPSVVRAVVMSALFIGGIVFQRSTHPLNTLGVAALILLASRPAALFDVGFQLSMGAVAAIVTVHPRLAEWTPVSWQESPVKEWFVSMVAVSAAATLGTAPVLLYHFGWVSVAGLVLNVVGIPATGLALSAALVMVSVGSLWPMAGAAFGSVADLFVEGLLLTSRQGTMWFSWAGFRMSEPNVWTIGVIAVGTVVLAQWPRPRHRWRCIIFALFLAVGGVWEETVQKGAGPTLDVLFFDVGQGDAVLVTTPHGRRVLVDTGPRSPLGSSEATTSVLPYLSRRGIEHLEAVVISHPDEDHLGGLPTILDELSVGRVLHSGQEVSTTLFEETRRIFARRGIPNEAMQRGDTLSMDSTVRFEVLGPPSNPEQRSIESENGQSVVLRLVYGRVDVLLSGDVEADAERDLVRTFGRRLSSRVVKVPHHGSETSSTKPFVKASTDTSRGTHAVVSVGKRNQFGMPAQSVLDRWASVSACVHSTARDGAVWLRTNGQEVWRVRWK